MYRIHASNELSWFQAEPVTTALAQKGRGLHIRVAHRAFESEISRFPRSQV